ncbi:MAG: GTPase Era [Oscillospiraceae bacterium]|nr:GTPase Era [Oscillospiraceae bacterium]
MRDKQTIQKTAMITISGRPNVGKSTLLNALVGEKIAIVTNKPQTTRNRILAVLNREETQLVFIDTPGYHAPRTRLGNYMVKVIRESVADVDAVILMVEPIPNIGAQEERLIGWIAANDVPSILVINKIDTVKKEELLEVINLYQAAHKFDAIVPISAQKGDGLEELIKILDGYALEGPQLFPDGMITDQPERQIIAEIIREKLLFCLQKEIPHGTAVEITKFSEREDSEIIDVEATIYVEKQSHKGMVIGKQGAMLRQVGEMARKDIERFMGAKVYLETWVKVKERWRDSAYLLRNFGYTNE